MADLTNIEIRKLERILKMEDGHLLEFTNKTFSNFFYDTIDKDIYEEKYFLNSGSKANRMRGFWRLESNYIVGKLLSNIFDNWNEYKGFSNIDEPSEEVLKIVQRLKSSSPVPDIDAVTPNSEDKDFETLAKTVRDSINRNEPEAGLDRLHTFLVKYFRVLCEKHNIIQDSQQQKKTPLHSMIGQYIKVMKANGAIESEMTERILKTSIGNIESFNYVRNNQSFAHDNKFLKYSEAMVIFGYVTSTIRFIEALEIDFEKLTKINN